MIFNRTRCDGDVLRGFQLQLNISICCRSYSEVARYWLPSQSCDEQLEALENNDQNRCLWLSRSEANIQSALMREYRFLRMEIDANLWAE